MALPAEMMTNWNLFFVIAAAEDLEAAILEGTAMVSVGSRNAS